jgi:hypothetical protein
MVLRLRRSHRGRKPGRFATATAYDRYDTRIRAIRPAGRVRRMNTRGASAIASARLLKHQAIRCKEKIVRIARSRVGDVRVVKLLRQGAYATRAQCVVLSPLLRQSRTELRTAATAAAAELVGRVVEWTRAGEDCYNPGGPPVKCGWSRGVYSPRTMPISDAERQRRRDVAAPIESRILELIGCDVRSRQGAAKQSIPGKDLLQLYEAQHGVPLDPAVLAKSLGLSGEPPLETLLRGNIFPALEVCGTSKKAGWYICRSAEPAHQAAMLVKVEDGILELLKRHEKAIDAGKLQDLFGSELRWRFSFRQFGCSNMRDFIERCDKLAIRM